MQKNQNYYSMTVSSEIYAKFITNFGNFVFGFFSPFWLHDFLYFEIRFCTVLRCSVKKVNKLLHNILVTSSLKTTKNQVAKLPKWDEKLISHL